MKVNKQIKQFRYVFLELYLVVQRNMWLKKIFLSQHCVPKCEKGHKKIQQLLGRYTLDIFAHDIEIKRYWDEKIFFSSKSCNVTSKYLELSPKKYYQ